MAQTNQPPVGPVVRIGPLALTDFGTDSFGDETSKGRPHPHAWIDRLPATVLDGLRRLARRARVTWRPSENAA